MVDYREKDFLELNGEILGGGNCLRFRIKGKSMEPFLRDKEVVIIQPIKQFEINPGDILFYRILPSTIVIHRLIKIVPENGKMVFVTKGDANFYFDPHVYSEDILGKIIAIERDGQNIRLNTFMSKLKAIFYVKFFLIKRWFWLILRIVKRELRHKMLGTALRKLQGTKIYSYLAKRFAHGKFTYRIATEKDAPLLAQLFKVYFPFTKNEASVRFFRKYLKDLVGSGYCILAECRSKIVGNTTVKNFPEDGTIYSGWRVYNRFVYWRYRRMGIGEGLMRMALKKAIEDGAISIKAIVSKDDKCSINLYKKLGFHEIKGSSPEQIIVELNKSDITYEL